MSGAWKQPIPDEVQNRWAEVFIVRMNQWHIWLKRPVRFNKRGDPASADIARMRLIHTQEYRGWRARRQDAFDMLALFHHKQDVPCMGYPPRALGIKDRWTYDFPDALEANYNYKRDFQKRRLRWVWP